MYLAAGHLDLRMNQDEMAEDAVGYLDIRQSKVQTHRGDWLSLREGGEIDEGFYVSFDLFNRCREIIVGRALKDGEQVLCLSNAQLETSNVAADLAGTSRLQSSMDFVERVLGVVIGHLDLSWWQPKSTSRPLRTDAEARQVRELGEEGRVEAHRGPSRPYSVVRRTPVSILGWVVIDSLWNALRSFPDATAQAGAPPSSSINTHLSGHLKAIIDAVHPWVIAVIVRNPSVSTGGT